MATVFDNLAPTLGPRPKGTVFDDLAPEVNVGSTTYILGYKAVGGGSNAPIHYGSHLNGGVWDITPDEAHAHGKQLNDIANELNSAGYVAVVRRKGQSKIESDHIHFADPKVNPKEAARLRKQAKRVSHASNVGRGVRSKQSIDWGGLTGQGTQGAKEAGLLQSGRQAVGEVLAYNKLTPRQKREVADVNILTEPTKGLNLPTRVGIDLLRNIYGASPQAAINMATEAYANPVETAKAIGGSVLALGSGEKWSEQPITNFVTSLMLLGGAAGARGALGRLGIKARPIAEPVPAPRVTEGPLSGMDDITRRIPSDTQNVKGLPSEVRVGQEPVQAQPVVKGSKAKARASRVFQAQEEVDIATRLRESGLSPKDMQDPANQAVAAQMLGVPVEEVQKAAVGAPVVETPKTVSPVTQSLADREAAILQRIADRKAKPSAAKPIIAGSKKGAVRFDLKLNPELVDYVELGAVKIAKGAVKFADWSTEMVRDIGEHVRPYLSRLWRESQLKHKELFTQTAGSKKPPPIRPVTSTTAPIGGEGLPKYAERPGEVGRINLERLNTADDLKNDLLRRVQETATSPERQDRLKTVTHEEAQQAAKDIGMTLDDVNKLRPGQALNDAELIALRDLHLTAQQELLDANGAFLVDPTPANKTAALEALANYRLLLDTTRGATAEAGRALSAMKVMAKARQGEGPLQWVAEIERAHKQLANSFGSEELSDALLSGLAQIPKGDSLALAKFVRDSSKASTASQIHSYLYGNMLSAPDTHLINQITNGLFAAQNAIMRPVYAAVDAGVSKLTGRQRNYYAREAGPAIAGMLEAIPRGLQRAAHVMEHGFDIAESNLDFAPSPELRFWEGNWNARKIRGKTILPAMPKNPWNAIKRAMVAGDVLWKEIARESELTALATRKAIAEGYKGQELAERIAFHRANATPEMLSQADRFAQYSTFQAESDKFTRSVVSALNTSVPQHFGKLAGLKPGRLIVPFVQVGSNMLKIGMEYGPMGFLKLIDPAVRQSPEVAQVVAKAAVGSATLGTLFMMTESGQMEVTGPAPQQPGERDLFYQSGKQPYSVKIGNKWVPYQRLGPMAYPLAVTAAFHDSMIESGEEPTSQRVMDALGSIGEFTLDQSYFQGLNALIEAVREPEKRGAALLGGVVTQAIPMGSAMRRAAQATDPMVRDVKGIYDRVKSNTPGLSRTIPAKITSLGEESKRGSRTGISALWPFSASYQNTDPVVVELVRLGIAPGFGSKSLKIGDERRKLTPAEWREYQKGIGSARKEALTRLVNSETYKSWNDEQRADEIADTLRRAAIPARTQFKVKLGDTRSGSHISRGPSISVGPSIRY